MLRSLLATAAVLAFLAGCGADAGPTGARTPVFTPATVAGSASAAADPAGVQACDLLKQSISQATLMEPGVVDAIGLAAGQADAPVADAARRLATAYAAAVAARGAAGEPDAVAAVSAAGAEMTRTCTDAGLETVG